MNNEEKIVFNYPYFNETVDIYRFLGDNYTNYKVYFSQYLHIPSVCIEDKMNKYEFFISKINNEVRIHFHRDALNKQSGESYSDILKNAARQVDQYLIKKGLSKKPLEPKQLSIFDFLQEAQ